MSVVKDGWKAADYFHKKYNKAVANDNGGSFKVEVIKGRNCIVHLVLWTYVMGRATHRFKKEFSNITYTDMVEFIDKAMKDKLKNYE